MDFYAANWTEDDNANSTPAPDGAPEGMAPSGINNVLRAHQGAAKRYVNQQSPKTTGGASTAFTLSYAVAPGALVDTMTHLVQFNAANGNAPTLNVNALGDIPLQYYSAGAWRAVPAALWDADEIFRVAYNSAAGAYRILNFRNRTGVVEAFAGSTAPAGSLLCFGQSLVRTEYAGLFAALGTTHGSADGTHFSLPDLRGRAAAGKDDMGGSAASRLTGTTMSPNGTTVGATGGAQTNTASTTSTGQTNSGPNSSVSVAAGVNFGVVSDGIPNQYGVSVFGTSAAFSTVQPTIILNYVIRI